jgi:tripartite-type tricarboxylate transporter receptor subunit TctC
MRRLLALALALLLAPAAAEAWPDRPITLIHPYAPGSASDATARLLAEEFGRILGGQVVVANRDGGSGTVGMLSLANSPPDGHTIAYAAITAIVVQPHMVRGLALGPDRVAPVCNVAENILGIVVRADSSIEDMRGLVAAAQRGSLTFGSPGPNSIPAIGVLRIRAAVGGNYEHVPYRGDPPALTELLGGRLDFAASVVASAGPMVRGGQLRLLGVFSAARHPDYPEAPTMQEQGIPVVQPSSAAIYAPLGTPAPILARLEAACREVVTGPAFQRLVATYGVVPAFSDHLALAAALREQFDGFGRSLAALGVRPE